MYKIFLQEGKKEEAIKRVKDMFSQDFNAIDKIFSETSKLGTKFIPFIENESKRYLIDQDMELSDFISLLNRGVEYFKKNSDRITPEVIGTTKQLWDGIESRPFPKFDNVMKAPKDINSYTSGTLGYLVDALSMIASKREREREAKKEAEKIFEDGDVIAVKALTHNASCYYGSGTRWCTAGQQPDYFNKYTRDGKLIYFIDKSNRRQKIALFIKDRSTYVYDAADREHGIEFLYHVYPEVENFVNEKLLGGGQVKQGLEDIKNGRVGRWGVSDIDPLMYSYDTDDKGNITLHLDFNQNNLDYWDLFDWNEGDADRIYLDMALSSYGSPDYFDSYTAEEDWKEGYLFAYFDDKQIETLQKLMKIINPKLYECTLSLQGYDRESCRDKVADFLEKTFEREVSDIISEYTYDMNQDTSEGIKKYLDENYANMFEEYGLPMTGTYYRKSVNFDDLMKTYRKYNPNFNLPLFSLLRKIIDVENISPPETADSIYEFRTGDYEYTDTYNAIEKLLYKMEEYIEENSEVSENYVDSYDFINKIGGFDKWFVMPGDERYDIQITDLDSMDNRVTFEFRNHENRGKFKKMRLPFEKFKDFIYNLQLF